MPVLIQEKISSEVQFSIGRLQMSVQVASRRMWVLNRMLVTERGFMERVFLFNGSLKWHLISEDRQHKYLLECFSPVSWWVIKVTDDKAVRRLMARKCLFVFIFISNIPQFWEKRDSGKWKRYLTVFSNERRENLSEYLWASRDNSLAISSDTATKAVHVNVGIFFEKRKIVWNQELIGSNARI